MPLFSSLSLYSSICINLKTGYVTTTLTQHKEVCDQRREKGNEREKGIERFQKFTSQKDEKIL